MRISREWTDDEPGLGGTFAELRRLGRRVATRPFRPFLYALLVTAAVVGMQARKVRTYSSRIVLRAAEGDLDASTAPRPAKRLREYVLEVAFSHHRLLELIKRRGLYPREFKKDPNYAVETMREDIEVEVWRNYFLELRGVLDAGRSARIAVSYEARSPDLAYEVVRELGTFIGEQETASRIAQADEAAQLGRFAVSEAREELLRRRGQIVAKEMAARHSPGATAALLRVEAANLQSTLLPLETRLTSLEQRRNDLDLRASMERARLGLTFELVDPGQKEKVGVSKRRELGILAAVVFAMVLPLCAIYAGAQDQRIFDTNDIRRLGLTALGHVEAFPGDNVAALDARLDREHNGGPQL